MCNRKTSKIILIERELRKPKSKRKLTEHDILIYTWISIGSFIVGFITSVIFIYLKANVINLM